MDNKSNSKRSAATIDEIINEIKSKSANGDYIYRGEGKRYEKVSSALYREYAKIIKAKEFDLEEFDLILAEKEMLRTARNHIGKFPVESLEGVIDATNEHEALTELQHYGGKTNLIDFTTDCFIALYFACSGHPKQVGRVIVLENDKKIEDMVVRPWNPRHRVIAQKSVFLQHPRGYIEVPEDNKVYIPAYLKQQMLDHLRKFHGISTESIYNDIHGFIRYQNIHQNAHLQSYMGSMFQKSAYKIESPERKQTAYEKAIEHYNEAINLNTDIGGVIYYNRGEALMHLQEWEKVLEDLTIAQNMGVDIIESFCNNYEGGVKEFEKKTDILLPPNIAEMLCDMKKSITGYYNGTTHGERCNAKTYPTRCKYCKKDVFYFSCDHGSKVFFDQLGDPWPVHSCPESNQRRVR